MKILGLKFGSLNSQLNEARSTKASTPDGTFFLISILFPATLFMTGFIYDRVVFWEILLLFAALKPLSTTYILFKVKGK